MGRLKVLVVLLVLAPGSSIAKDIIFSSPPRESVKDGNLMYGAIASYLSGVIGHRVIYKHPTNWLIYIDNMQHDVYDLVFDGPHFISYRMAKYNHVPLVKLPGQLDFVVISRKDNNQITELRDLAGRPVCGHTPPNLATLTLQAQFDNPIRQPRVLETRGFKKAYLGVIKKTCHAASIPSKIYKEFNKEDSKKQTHILYKSQSLPHQAFSAGSRVSPALRAKITAALLDEKGNQATAKLRQRFVGGKTLTKADPERYQGLAYLLKYVWGFEL